MGSSKEEYYSQQRFQAEPRVQILVHACLFAQNNTRFQYALANYCFHYFVHKQLGGADGGEASNPDWFDFFYFPEKGASVNPDVSAELLTSDDPTRSLPAFVAWALVWHPILHAKPAGIDDMTVHAHLPTTQVIGAADAGGLYGMIKALDLMNSLHADSVDATGTMSPFKRLNMFVKNVLNDASARAREMNGDPKFFYTPPGEIPITRAGGLDARSVFFMCFKIFRQVFNSAGGGDKTHPRIIDAYNPFEGSDTPHDDIASVVAGGYYRETPGWTFYIPLTWDWRRSNALEAVQTAEGGALPAGRLTGGAFGATGTSSEFTAFTNDRAATDLQLRKMITGLSQLGAIRRGIYEARIKVGGVTAGVDASPIIKEFFPSDGTPAQRERGKTLFSRFDGGHIVNVQRNVARMLPFIGLDQGEGIPNPSQKALLPYYRRIGGTTTNPSGGRAKMLRSLLVNDPKFSVSAENMFDPTNAKIMCMGLPAGGITALHTPAIPLSNDGITSGLLEAPVPEWNRDNSLLKVGINKVDALLPGITYKDVEFYYDPRLYVAPDGFDDCVSGIPLVDQLHKVKFRRGNTNDSGTVTEGVNITVGNWGVPDWGVDYDPDLGFIGPCGLLRDTPPEVAKQIAYVTARSDLLNFYVSLVNGMELGEESFHIDEGLMDQRIDSHMTEFNYNSIDVVPPIPRISDFPFPDMGSHGELDVMSDWNEELYGDFGTFRIKMLSELAGVESDVSEASMVYSQQFLSSLLFKPHATRIEMLYPRRFDGVLFFLVDPDMFIVTSFDPDDAKIIPTRDLLVAANVAKEEPPDSDTYYIIKSGDNEDGAGVIELTVTFTNQTYVDSTLTPYTPMLEGL